MVQLTFLETYIQRVLHRYDYSTLIFSIVQLKFLETHIQIVLSILKLYYTTSKYNNTYTFSVLGFPRLQYTLQENIGYFRITLFQIANFSRTNAYELTNFIVDTFSNLLVFSGN